MGSTLRISLVTLFAVCGAAAAVCVALVALPEKPKPAAVAVVPIQNRGGLSPSLRGFEPVATEEIRYPAADLPEPALPPDLSAAARTAAADWQPPTERRSHSKKSASERDFTEVAPTSPPAPEPTETAPAPAERHPASRIASDENGERPAAPRNKLTNMLRPNSPAGVVCAVAAESPCTMQPATREISPTATASLPDMPAPLLLSPPMSPRPILPSSEPLASAVVLAQVSEPAHPTSDLPIPTAPAPVASSPADSSPPAPAPNSPEATKQVHDEMDELRKMLEGTAQSQGAESVAKPSPAEGPVGKSGKTRAKISKVGEGDEHFALDIQDADIRDVLEMISRQGQINILPSNSVKGKVTASLHDVDLDSALAAILKSTGYVTRRHGKFIYVGTSKDFDNLEQSLDKIGTRIYHTNYVRAADLQALITPLLTQGVGAMSVTSPAEQGIATDATKAGGNTFAGGDAVLVRDYEAVLAEIDQVVAEIDKRPLQVAIEAMILSVALDDNYQFGVNFQFLRNNPHIAFASGSPPAAISDVSFSNGGLTFGFLDTTLGAFITAVETIGDTHVIATPRVVCLDKQRAEILIGSQLGYISSTVTETSTAQNVNFLEVGTQLRIRPFISSDGLVRMEVHPELSTGQVTTQGGFTLPDKDLTQVTTNVMVRDGATVVIGGLIREDLTTNTTQIPLLGDLPGVGWLFRQKQEQTQRNEILVLITPHIVYDCEAAAEGAHGATEFHRREAVYADQMSPIGKRHLGRKYYRLAQEAFAAGDQPRALRFVDLAIHFDPLNRAAIDLRTDIVTGNHFGEHTEVKFPTVTAPAASMVTVPEGQNLPGWMLNELDHHPPEAPVPLPPPPVPHHPLDPGQPGCSTPIERPYQFE